MDTLHNMLVFQVVAETESFTLAAERLKISRSLATRQVMQLEQSIGARLFNRTTRKISLTAIGATYLEKISPALAELQAAGEIADLQTQHISGTLRINAPVSLGSNYLGKDIADFMRLNPALAIDVTLNDRRVDPTEEGFDLAIRVTARPSQAQISRRICHAQLGLFASKAYLERFGTPTHPNQIQADQCLAYSYMPTGYWAFRDPDSGKSFQIPIKGRLQANNGDFLARVCAQAVSLVQGPFFTVPPELRQQSLVPILRPFWNEPLTVHAVMPSRRFQPLKVRSFVDFLVARWQMQPPWEQ